MQIGGILAINKPIGLSTYDLIRFFKKTAGFNGKIGHAGTLDVFGSGLVLILLGKATKQFQDWQTYDKQYLASARLYYSTDTLDIEGKIEPTSKIIKLDRARIEAVFPHFIGNIRQKIPAYSATKYHGQPLYKLARKGQQINKEKSVNIKEIKLVAFKSALVSLDIVCASGTYIRQLVYDLFQELEVRSFLFSLTRTRIGPISLKNSHDLKILTDNQWKKHLIEL